MADSFKLAHLSDLHLGPLPPFGAQHWNLKRALGYANWHRNRRGVHRPEVAAALVADLKRQTPDHIAVTGDLINIGLPAEYEAALAWLEALGPPDLVSVVPGNHDIYTRLGRDPGVARWRRYMTHDASATDQPHEFPFVRRRGRVALIGLNSAVPTPPLVAAGRLGREQLARLAATLDQLGQDGLARIVLIHHPPLPGQASRMKALRDAAAIADILCQHGAELVLHGHNHRRELWHLAWQAGVVPIVGVPSVSLAAPHKREPLARYHLFRVTLGAGPPRVTLIARGFAEVGGPVVEIERHEIGAAADHSATISRHAGTT